MIQKYCQPKSPAISDNPCVVRFISEQQGFCM